MTLPLSNTSPPPPAAPPPSEPRPALFYEQMYAVYALWKWVAGGAGALLVLCVSLYCCRRVRRRRSSNRANQSGRRHRAREQARHATAAAGKGKQAGRGVSQYAPFAPDGGDSGRGCAGSGVGTSGGGGANEGFHARSQEPAGGAARVGATRGRAGSGIGSDGGAAGGYREYILRERGRSGQYGFSSFTRSGFSSFGAGRRPAAGATTRVNDAACATISSERESHGDHEPARPNDGSRPPPPPRIQGSMGAFQFPEPAAHTPRLTSNRRAPTERLSTTPPFAGVAPTYSYDGPEPPPAPFLIGGQDAPTAAGRRQGSSGLLGSRVGAVQSHQPQCCGSSHGRVRGQSFGADI